MVSLHWEALGRVKEKLEKSLASLYHPRVPRTIFQKVNNNHKIPAHYLAVHRYILGDMPRVVELSALRDMNQD